MWHGLNCWCSLDIRVEGLKVGQLAGPPPSQSRVRQGRGCVQVGSGGSGGQTQGGCRDCHPEEVGGGPTEGSQPEALLLTGRSGVHGCCWDEPQRTRWPPERLCRRRGACPRVTPPLVPAARSRSLAGCVKGLANSDFHNNVSSQIAKSQFY